jgi:putative SOS response-associated peptidase YedK
MCYRYSNAQQERDFRKSMKNIRSQFSETESGEPFSFNHANGFSHGKLPVVAQIAPDDLSFMHWGLIPFFTKTEEDKVKLWKRGWTLNARAEEIFTKNSWREPIKKKRCLIPATGFIEWRDIADVKYPYLVRCTNSHFPDDVQPFCLAGVYDTWTDKATGSTIDSFAIITTEANDLMKQVHVNPSREDGGARMPVIVRPESYNTWLGTDTTFEQLEAIMAGLESKELCAYTISKDITKRGFDFSDNGFLAHQPYEIEGSSFNLN